jgi:vitamin B12 transporter
MSRLYYLSALTAAFTPVLCHAADTETLPETLVTATRTSIPGNELATAATTFTRADIERLQARTLPDLLKQAPGVDVVQNGGYGQPTKLNGSKSFAARNRVYTARKPSAV